MANVWFIGDTHIGHKNIANFRKFVSSEQDNRDQLEASWRRLVTKRDLVWVLGDSCFTQEGLDWFKSLPGEKRLVRGNHDNLPTEEYLKVFTTVEGLVRYKGYWLSHAPIHPLELRGKKCVHGHNHYHNIPDDNYLNVCPENLTVLTGEWLISLNQVRAYFNEEK